MIVLDLAFPCSVVAHFAAPLHLNRRTSPIFPRVHTRHLEPLKLLQAQAVHRQLPKGRLHPEIVVHHGAQVAREEDVELGAREVDHGARERIYAVLRDRNNALVVAVVVIVDLVAAAAAMAEGDGLLGQLQGNDFVAVLGRQLQFLPNYYMVLQVLWNDLLYLLAHR